METKMETKKIAIACFVGGVVGTGVALIYTPLFWWLGMLAGFGAGYVCYDLKEILEKAPIAWRAAKKEGGLILEWLVEPHPFLYLFGIIVVAIYLPIIWIMVERTEAIKNELIELGLLPLLFGFLPSFLVMGLLLLCTISAGFEAHKKKCFWEPSLWFFSGVEKENMFREGYQIIPVTYKNIYGLMFTGLGHLLLAVIVTAPKIVGYGLFYFLRFLFRDVWVLMARFFWYLFKLIHSQKRVLCGIDSAIGTAIAYFSLGINATTPAEKVMVIVCGGIIGAVVGILNFEIVSKHILRLLPT